MESADFVTVIERCDPEYAFATPQPGKQEIITSPVPNDLYAMPVPARGGDRLRMAIFPLWYAQGTGATQFELSEGGSIEIFAAETEQPEVLP